MFQTYTETDISFLLGDPRANCSSWKMWCFESQPSLFLYLSYTTSYILMNLITAKECLILNRTKMLWNRYARLFRMFGSFFPLSLGVSFVIELCCVKKQLAVKGIPENRIDPDSSFSKL